MKTFKKSLCLVLALVMVLGVCMVGAGAVSYETYTDAEAVAASDYADAINVITDLGIMSGDDNEAFLPEGTFTRAMAAKVVATVALASVEKAEALGKMTNVVTGFSDVDVEDGSVSWARGYIQYCKSAGIINGMGDGTFAPKAEVTGIQMAKMLLCALGYGAKGEYVGQGWDINVWVKAVDLGLTLSDVDSTAPAKRGEIAQYVYNILDEQPVAMDKDTGIYVVNTNKKSLQAVTGVSDPCYALIVANQATVAKAKGTTVKIWDAKNKVYDDELLLTGYVTDETMIGHEIALTYQTSAKGVSTALVANDVSTAATATDVATAAKTKVPTVLLFNNYGKAYTVEEDTAVAAYSIFTTGTIVKLVHGGYTRMYTDYTISYVNSFVKATSTKAAYYTVAGIADATTGKAIEFAAEDLYEGVAKNDQVKVTLVGGVYKFEKLSYVDVKVTSVGQDMWKLPVVLNGAYSYDYSVADSGVYGTDKYIPFYSDELPYKTISPDATTSIRLYLSGANTYYAWSAVPADDDNATYVMLVAGTMESSNVAKWSTSKDTYYAQCVTVDGEIVEYVVGSTNPTYMNKDGSVKALGVYSVSEPDKDGVVTLAPAKNSAIVSVDGLKTNAVKVGDYYYTNSSKKVVLNGKTGADLVATVGAPATEISGTAYVLWTKVTGKAVENISAVWYMGDTTINVVSNSFIYVDAADTYPSGKVINDTDKETYNTFAVYVDGVKTTVQMDANTLAGGVFSQYSIDKNNVYELKTFEKGYAGAKVVLDKYYYIYEGKLTVKGSFEDADISAMTIVDITAAATYTAPVADTAAIEELVADGYTVTLAFVTKTVDSKVVPTGALYITYTK